MAYETAESDIMKRPPRNPFYDKLVNDRCSFFLFDTLIVHLIIRLTKLILKKSNIILITPVGFVLNILHILLEDFW